MYNRYIPQADGTYRRNRVQDPTQPSEEHRPPPPPPQRSQEEMCEEPGKQEAPLCSPPPGRPGPTIHRGDSVPDFLRQLLPRDFDTGDLIVVLLLLLLAGDCPEDRSTALLTLALYLFM